MATSRVSAERAAVDLSFEELYRGHHADVYRAALRELGNVQEAEDVTQAAFVDAYRAILRGTHPQSPRAWLLAISENVRRRRFRTAQKRPREEPMDANFPLAADLPYEQAHALADALASLPAEQRRVFVLRELAGLSYDEIAGEVDATVPAIQMLLFRARRALRAELDPPVVAQRKAGVLLPVPAWLTTLVSRSELVWLTPRAAGAMGAVVMAVVGAGVAVSQTPADGRPLPANEPQSPTLSIARATPVVAVTPAAPKARPSAAPTKPRPVARGFRPARAARAVSPAASSQQASQPAPTAAPAPAPTPAPSALVPAKAADTPVLERLRPGVSPLGPPLVREVRNVLEQPAAPVLPPLSAAPVLEAAAGAVDAAGANVPPLPVPALPPVTLPPALDEKLGLAVPPPP